MMAHDAKRFYNEHMPKKFGSDYEYERWHKEPIREAGYLLTKEAIERHVLLRHDLAPKHILEVGPGPGVWTKYLLARFPDAACDLVDISREMLDRARSVLGDRATVRYIEADILEFTSDVIYELFFASRMLEYVPEKHAFAQKIFQLLAPGGVGFMITKMPHYGRERLMGRRLSALHRGQIAPVTVMNMLRDVGFIDIRCFPVTVSVPLLHNALLNRSIGRMLSRFKVGPIGALVTESYCVLFRKP